MWCGIGQNLGGSCRDLNRGTAVICREGLGENTTARICGVGPEHLFTILLSIAPLLLSSDAMDRALEEKCHCVRRVASGTSGRSLHCCG
jgi:hypothetical protein